MEIKNALSFARENDCVMADVLYTDFSGRLRRVGVPLQHFSAKAFEDGVPLGVDERGESLVALPDPATAKLDPFAKAKTIAFLAEMRLSGSPASHPLDPRATAKKAAAALKDSGFADSARFCADVQFYFFDDVRFDQNKMSSFHLIESVEGQWNSGREENPNLGYKGRGKGEANMAAPFDAYADLRQDAVGELLKMGVGVERERKGPAVAGQGEISLKSAPLVEMADNITWLKYVLRNAAIHSQKTVTFMASPLDGEPASALGLRLSLWRGGKNLFAENEPLPAHCLGGLNRHAAALSALLRPTVNSYRATRAGAAFAKLSGGEIECNLCDPSANPYLALPALALAALDGAKNNAAQKAAPLPKSLEAALGALGRDGGFLTAPGVFEAKTLADWAKKKRLEEVEVFGQRVTPLDFTLYFDL